MRRWKNPARRSIPNYVPLHYIYQVNFLLRPSLATDMAPNARMYFSAREDK